MKEVCGVQTRALPEPGLHLAQWSTARCFARETADGALVHCLDWSQPYDPRPAYFMREMVDVIMTCQTLT